MCPPTGNTSRITTAAPDTHPGLLPQTQLCRGAYQLARKSLPPAILNHSIRVCIYAKKLAEVEYSEWAIEPKLDLLCVACLLHDIGCAKQFDGPQRFEVEGADAAADYLRQHDVSDSDVHEVWQAIALHTSPGIAERISSLARLVRAAVLVDFSTDLELEVWMQNIRRCVEKAYPRQDIEKILGDTVVDQAISQPDKAPPASWPGILLRAKREFPEWDGVNKAF